MKKIILILLFCPIIMFGQSVTIADTLIELENEKTSIKELISFEIIDVYDDDYGDANIKIKITSLDKKTIRALKFKMFIISKKGMKELGYTERKVREPVNISYISNHVFMSGSCYTLLKGASKNDYSYRFQITSMIYDGELIVE